MFNCQSATEMWQCQSQDDEHVSRQDFGLTVIWSSIVRLMQTKRNKKLFGEATYRAIFEVELLCCLAEDLSMEVDKEGSDGVLVGLPNAFPQVMLPFDNVIPFQLRICCHSSWQSIS